jgi:translation elongation factor EF-4
MRYPRPRAEGRAVDNPSKLPDPNQIEEVREPIMPRHILVPQEYLGGVINALRGEAWRAEGSAIPRQPGAAHL